MPPFKFPTAGLPNARRDSELAAKLPQHGADIRRGLGAAPAHAFYSGGPAIVIDLFFLHVSVVDFIPKLLYEMLNCSNYMRSDHL